VVKDLVANSPFIDIGFTQSGSKLNNSKSEAIFDYYKLASNTIEFQIDRDFTDYRITPYFSEDQIKDLKIEYFQFDSLSYFQVSQFLNQNNFTSIEIVKSDISVYLELPESYESYLNALSKKNRHELKRKKRIFVKKFGDISFEKSKNNEIFDEFVRLHKKSTGEKGKYMTKVVVDFYRSLIEQENWYIYYINYNDSMISSAFVYESEIVDYLYNSCRDHTLEEFNTGTYLNDQLLQNSIKNKKQYFDYLKGEEKYKFNFGGQVHQLYDLKIKV
jgi:hypothetical protein